MQTVILIAATLIAPFLLIAQQTGSEPAAADHIRTVHLQIQKEIRLDPQFGGALALPVQCGPDGKIYAGFLNQDGSEEQLVGIASDGKATRFELPHDVNLHNPIWIAHYVSEESLVAHIKAQGETKWVHLKTSTGKEIGNRQVGTMHDHLMTFALDGTLKSQLSLDMPFDVLQAAPFRSGMLLVAGIDRDTKDPIIALASENGSYLRRLTVKGDLDRDTFKTDPNAMKGMESFESHLENSSLIPDGTEILLVRNETDTPVFAVRQSGEVKAVRVKGPPGYKPFSITPTRDGWITQFVQDLGKGRVIPNTCLVDRNTGTAVQCYETDMSLGLGFACYDPDNTLSFLRGGTKENPHRSSIVIAGGK
jgi:hypothetical protein